MVILKIFLIIKISFVQKMILSIIIKRHTELYFFKNETCNISKTLNKNQVMNNSKNQNINNRTHEALLNCKNLLLVIY